MDSEILLRLLPKEYEYKINNIKILGRSTILEEQQLKANFVVNICDKAQAGISICPFPVFFRTTKN